MRILVAGVAGFIGSHLTERLLQDGHEVFGIDNFITGNPRNIATFREHERFHLIEHDLTLPLRNDLIRNEDLRFLENREGKLDQIYHLACPSALVDEQDIPLQILWINAAATKNMLELAVRHDAHFLLASSAEVYGRGDSTTQPTIQKIAEDFRGFIDHLAPFHALQQGKIFAESLAMNYYRHFRFALKIGRIFNTYGPRMRRHDGQLLAEFIEAARHDEPLRIPTFSDGTTMQVNLCYVDDIVDGLIALMNTPKDFLGPVNLGGSDLFSSQKIAEWIVEITKSSSLIVPMAEEKNSEPWQGERGPLLPDLNLAREKLGFEPKIEIMEGLLRTLA